MMFVAVIAADGAVAAEAVEQVWDQVHGGWPHAAAAER
jgi:hypothetical protein